MVHPVRKLDPIAKHAEVRGEAAATEMRPESDKATAEARPPAKKDRRIVSWTPEEDKLLREQISAHGTENWTSIAARFKDKTSRQCRRRWYTYLNSDAKKGGWSPEEDMLLCEAQKIFGNRWTEIAKVVSGRTDNAVKNRFSTLCKKREKNDALTKENNGSWVNTHNKRGITHNESFMAAETESPAPMKQIRYHNSDHTENCIQNETSSGRPTKGELQLRSPLSMLSQNINGVGRLPSQYPPDNSKAAVYDGPNKKSEGGFLRKDDPKLTALLQQAELLSSLALKVNSESTSQSLENAWKELKDYLIQNGEIGISAITSDMEFLLDDFGNLMEDLSSGGTGEELLRSPSSGQPGLHEESQDSPVYSSGSMEVFSILAKDSNQTETTILSQSAQVSCHQEVDLGPGMCTSQAFPSSGEQKETVGNVCTRPSSEYDSPHQMIPTFKSLTEGIPSPNFSASERQFLLSVLGISSPAPVPGSAQQPSCKRVLLDSL